MRKVVVPVLFLLGFLLKQGGVAAQPRTVGKIYYDDSLAFLGYTLFSPNSNFNTYLIENCGRLVHEWTSAYRPGMMSYLRTDGKLVRACRDGDNFWFGSSGGNGGILEMLDWGSTRIWEHRISDSVHLAHHDIFPMPNGNILVLAWEKFTFNQAKQAGRNLSLLPDQELWGEVIYEVKPVLPNSATIVWEWHVWDHLIQDYNPAQDNYGVVGDHPELLDVNYIGISQGKADWLHANSVAYNPVRDEVIISFREISEIMVIDHSTTTAEAAGHTGGNRGKGGDILWRWGNPEAYRRGQASDQKLFQQHDIHWLDDNTRLVMFNNGLSRNAYSTVEVVEPSIDVQGDYVLATTFQPDTAIRTYAAQPGDTFDSNVMGGAQFLPNGNLIVSQAVHGRFVEYDSAMNRVWEYISPALPLGVFVAQGYPVPAGSNSWTNSVFKCRKYGYDYPGLQGKVLIPGDFLEVSPYPDSCSTPVGVKPAVARQLELFPNPVVDILHCRLPQHGLWDWEVIDAFGKVVRSGRMSGNTVDVDLAGLPNGMLFFKVGQLVKPVILLH